MARKHNRHGAKKPQKSTAQKISFEITSLDPLGQGVSKDNTGKTKPEITFIAKTLPSEKGTARLLRQSKGVRFAQLEDSDSITSPAANRIKSECPHFNECPACHFLHTDYQSELNYKQDALLETLKRLDLKTNIEVIAAEQRLHYRNRIQLHYRHKYIGMVDPLQDQIVEIPNCQIIRPELQKNFDDLYNDKSWAEDQSASGHVEIYLQAGDISRQWNSRYAHGGFTQVNEQMNTKLREVVNQSLSELNLTSLLDLFSGSGNLSNDFNSSAGYRRTMIDMSNEVDHPDYLKMDLFEESSLQEFRENHKPNEFDVMLIDPPRKGFPLLANWVKKIKPGHLIYVSCNAQSMARDLMTLKDARIKYRLDRLLLVDLFPGTYHYETVVCLSFPKFKKPKKVM